MLVLKSTICFEEVIKGSKFLSELFPCESQSQARDLVKAQKTKYPDATHVVHAFVIGPGAEILGMSDDGEPSGTAGRPTLDVLKGFLTCGLSFTPALIKNIKNALEGKNDPELIDVDTSESTNLIDEQTTE